MNTDAASDNSVTYTGLAPATPQPNKKIKKIVKDPNKCKELDNIKYNMGRLSTSLSNKSGHVHTRPRQTVESIDSFLAGECSTNKEEPWSKLNKTIKLKKLQSYIDVLLANTETENDDKKERVTAQLQQLFKVELDRKRLQNNKEVQYNKKTGTITSIPALVYDPVTNIYTIKNTDKRAHTTSSLKKER